MAAANLRDTMHEIRSSGSKEGTRRRRCAAVAAGKGLDGGDAQQWQLPRDSMEEMPYIVAEREQSNLLMNVHSPIFA